MNRLVKLLHKVAHQAHLMPLILMPFLVSRIVRVFTGLSFKASLMPTVFIVLSAYYGRTGR
jgi:hypothetical protein